MAGIKIVATITPSSAASFRRQLDRLGTRAAHELGGSLYRRAEEVMTESKLHYVPVDVGVLRDSGFVDLPEVSGNRVAVQLGYGGAAEAYALAQHEHMEYRHTVGGPKYLERPMLEAAKDLDAWVAGDLRGRL